MGSHERARARVCARPLGVSLGFSHRNTCRARLSVAAWVCTRVFVDDEERGSGPGGDKGRRTSPRGKGERKRERAATLPFARRRSSLSVNTGYVERRAGLNWHQLPAKHPPRTFSPPVFPCPCAPEALPTHPLDARSPQRKEKSAPQNRNDITLWKYIYLQLT